MVVIVVGAFEGANVGLFVGNNVGNMDGVCDGIMVGCDDGETLDGNSVGEKLGLKDG